MMHIKIIDALFIRAINWSKPEIKIPFEAHNRNISFRDIMTAHNKCPDHTLTPSLYCRAVCFGDIITGEDVFEEMAEERTTTQEENEVVANNLIAGVDDTEESNGLMAGIIDIGAPIDTTEGTYNSDYNDPTNTDAPNPDSNEPTIEGGTRGSDT